MGDGLTECRRSGHPVVGQSATADQGGRASVLVLLC